MGTVSSLKDRVPSSNVFHNNRSHSPFPLNRGVSIFFSGSMLLPTMKILLLFVAFIPITSSSGWAWERNTHEEITEQAIRIMEGDLNSYLINNLGLENGLNESVMGSTPEN